MGNLKQAVVACDEADAFDALLGQAVFIRTVTYAWTGRLDLMDDKTFVLSSAAWIADTGRFADAMAGGVMSEVEPVPGPVYVNRGAVVDVQPWEHDLPCEQK